MEDEIKDEAEAQDDSTEGSSATIKPETPKSVREFVTSKRAERAATESTQSSKSEPEKSRDDEATEGAGDESKTVETQYYTDEQMASMDLRDAEPDRVPLAVRETVRKLQAAERKKHTTLNDKATELEDLIARAKEGIQLTASRQTEPEAEEELSFSKEELRQIFRSKQGKQFLSEAFEEIGMPLELAQELADRQFMQSAVADATGEFKQLAEPKFFDEVVALIRDTPRWAKVVKESKDKMSVSLVFQAAAGKIRDTQSVAERAAMDKEKLKADEDKKKLKAAKEAANKKPSSHAAGAGRKPTVPLGERPSVREFVTQARAARNNS